MDELTFAEFRRLCIEYGPRVAMTIKRVTITILEQQLTQDQWRQLKIVLKKDELASDSALLKMAEEKLSQAVIVV